MKRPPLSLALLPVLALATAGLAMPLQAQYREEITNDMDRCTDGAGPAVRVTVNGIRSSGGSLRVQSYRGTSSDWLKKGRWINRIETTARRGSMTFCLPLPAAGTYAVAVRHDANGNGKTDLSSDGGGMSNNPPINIFNLGRPSHTRTAITVGNDVRSIQIDMKYM